MFELRKQKLQTLEKHFLLIDLLIYIYIYIYIFNFTFSSQVSIYC